MGVKLIEHHAAHGSALDVNHHADAHPAAGLVAQTGDAGDLFIIDQFGNLLHHIFFVYGVRDLGDDDLLFAVGFEYFRLGADSESPSAGGVEFADFIFAAQNGAGRKVRTGQMLHQLVNRRRRVFHNTDRGIDHFGQVVRRNTGRHTDPDTGRAVHQQLRETRRQDCRFLRRLVKGERHVNGIFFNVGQQFFRQALHAALGVTVGRGGVAVNTAEVTLSVNQRGAH